MQQQRRSQQKNSDSEDGSMSSKKWTFRGAGSDHEILVQLRESTPTSDANGGSPGEKSTKAASPDRLQCAQCKRMKLVKDFWWCRTCQKTMCSSCNLLQGHTEHRTAPWLPQELVRSLMDTVEARCTARTVRASEEEAAIKEYMREIENYFLSKLNNRLEERNKMDRDLLNAISASTGVALLDLKGWPYSAMPPAPVTANGTSTNLAQFSSLLTDDSLARLVQEISNRLLSTKEGPKKLTVTKCPRMFSTTPPTISPTASPFLNGRLNESGGTTGEEDDMQVVTQHFYSFAAVLPNVEPLEFAQLLEQQSGFSPRLRSRSHSGLPPRGITPTVEKVSSRTQSPAPHAINGPVKMLAVYSTINVDGEVKKAVIQTDGPARLPTSPTATSRSEFVRGDYERRSIPSSPPAITTRTQTVTTTNTQVVQAVISNEPRSRTTSPPSASTSSQSETTPTPRSSPVKETPRSSPVKETPRSSPVKQTEEPTPTESKRRYSLPSRRKSPSKEASPAALADTSTDTNMDDEAIPRRQRQLSSPTTNSGKPSTVSVIAFHFGEDFLTRPIDIRPLDNDMLAVSDSCGGVYITDIRGTRILHQIWLDGNSASSLCYVPFFVEQPRRSPLLLVSILGKNDRSIHFYETNKFTLVDNVPCPDQPEIDTARSRWLGTDDRGSVYLITGDGKMSALWKFHSNNGKPWSLVKQTPDTRYQYLDVVHHLADSNSIALLTSDGIRGAILLITVSRTSAKVLAEQDFTDSYGLNQYIRSPASVCVDYRGNMLILDYSNGKLWLLKASRGNRQGGDRRLKLLTEFGAQQAMGIAVTPIYWQSERFVNNEQWCYVACFNKRRVHAVKYLSD